MEKSKKSPNGFIKSDPMSIAILILIVIGSFFMGSMWTKLKSYESGKVEQKAGTGADGKVADTGNPADTTKADVTKPSDADHTRGNKNAKIALVEYSDFDCPYCATFHETESKIVSEYGDKVMWVYRHFPLDMHPESHKKAEASECVFAQGGNDKFWEFSDKLFKEVPKVADLGPIVTSLGLDANKFNDCLTKGEQTQKVKDQFNDGLKAGVQGTPGSHIMNMETGEVTTLGGAVPYENLKQMVDSILNK